MPTPAFDKWAKGFSGCDGGNLAGSIWLCGIEWGLGKNHTLEEEMEALVSEPPQIYASSSDVLRSPEGRPYPFNRMFLKLVSVMRGRPIEEWEDLANETPFPFHRKSDYFKLNLFPVAFQKVDSALWDKRYRRATGLATRREYVEWCTANRFPVIRSWVERGQPRLIVGVGLSDVENFKHAFGIQGPEHEEIIEGKRLIWVQEGPTTLAIVPFPTSPSGLNSNRAIQAFGERLAAILDREKQREPFRRKRLPTRVAMSVAPALSAKDGWNGTYSNPRSGAQTEFIERALSNIPRTADELAEIANLIAGREDYVKAERVTQHLTYHHETLGASQRARRSDQKLRMPQIRHSRGRWCMPGSMRPQTK